MAQTSEPRMSESLDRVVDEIILVKASISLDANYTQTFVTKSAFPPHIHKKDL
jgi:hypothetical protein